MSAKSTTRHPLISRYTDKVVPALTAAKQYESTYEVPRVTKVSVNIGAGNLTGNSKGEEEIQSLLQALTGQKAAVTRARTAIAGFKIRRGTPVGLRVTLRGNRMRDFLFKLIEVALPRTRDFRGLKPSAVTADGSLHIGIKDSMIFPDVSVDSPTHSLQVTVSSTGRDAEETKLLFEQLGFYFQPADEVVAAPRRRRRYQSKRK